MTDYQLAKSQIANDPRSVKPESLTRRNGTLIARYFCPRWDRRLLQQMLANEIKSSIPKAHVHKVTVDRHYTGRVYFSLS